MTNPLISFSSDSSTFPSASVDTQNDSTNQRVQTGKHETATLSINHAPIDASILPSVTPSIEQTPIKKLEFPHTPPEFLRLD